MKFRAAPHAAVMKLQMPIPHAMIARRLRWSGEPRDGKSEDGIEEREGEPAQQAHL
jgi:hypothetical protein